MEPSGRRPRTLDEVGRTFNVTRERIRQIEHQALGKLQKLDESEQSPADIGGVPNRHEPQRRLSGAVPPPSVVLSHSPVAQLFEGAADRSALMVEPSSPGPGRSTAEAALNEVKKEIARRNEKAQQAARKSRSARKNQQIARRRKSDSL